MAFWTVKTDKDSISDGGGNYIIDSGMYDVIIKNCIVRRGDESAGKKSMWLDLIVDYNGTIQTIYRAIGLKNNDGSANFGEKMLNKLCVICGGQAGFEIGNPTTKSVCTNQKEGTNEEVEVLEEFEDQPVTMRIAKEYRRYNGEIRRNAILKQLFRTVDKKTANEIINGKEAKQYAIEEATASETAYRDEITEEEAKAYEEGRKTSQPQPQSTEPKKRRFGSSSGSEDNIDSVPF